MGGKFYLCKGHQLSTPLLIAALPPPQVSALAAQLMSALAFMHGRGVVHLDIKPDNIMAMAPTIGHVAGGGGLGGGPQGFGGGGDGGGTCQQLKITDFGKKFFSCSKNFMIYWISNIITHICTTHLPLFLITGASRVLAPSELLTKLLGTPKFSAPEVHRGEGYRYVRREVRHRSCG